MVILVYVVYGVGCHCLMYAVVMMGRPKVAIWFIEMGLVYHLLSCLSQPVSDQIDSG